MSQRTRVWVLTFCLLFSFLNSIRLSNGNLPGSPSQSQLSWEEFLKKIHQAALQFSEDLPNFICTQVTRRYVDPGKTDSWQVLDLLEADLTYNQKQETYSGVMINGQPSKRPYESLGGTLSVGEFGSILRSLFLPETQTSFWRERDEDLGTLRTVVVGFAVRQSTSGWTLSAGQTHSLKVAYTGSVWVDARNYRILRINQHTHQLPASFPIAYSEITTEYGYRSIRGIEGEEFLLPMRAELIMRESPKPISTRNLIEFRNYRRFTSEVKLVPDIPN